MPSAPRIVDAPAVRTAAIHVIVPRERIQEAMGPAIQELFGTVTAQGVGITGPWFTLHHRRPTDTFDFDVCVPVATAVTPAGRVRPGERRAARVARAVHEGDYDGLGAAWGAFQQWLDANGQRTADDFWETYLVGPEAGNDATKYRTQLDRPLLAGA